MLSLKIACGYRFETPYLLEIYTEAREDKMVCLGLAFKNPKGKKLCCVEGLWGQKKWQTVNKH